MRLPNFGAAKHRIFSMILVLYLLQATAFCQEDLDSLSNLPYDEMVSDLSKSRLRLQAGLSKAVENKSRRNQAEILSKLSTVTYLQGELGVALEHAINAISIYEELNLPAKVGGLYCSIGYSLKRRSMDEANAYMRKGLKILETNFDTNAIEAGFNNYGVLKEMENQLDSAVFYYSKSLDLATARQDSIAMPYALNHLASVSILQEQFDDAKQLFTEAYIIRKSRNEAYGVLENTIYFGDYFQATNQTDSAVFYYHSAINQTYQVGYPYMRQYSFKQLATVYEKTGNAPLALKAQKAYSSIKDSLITEKRTEELAKMETKFKTAQKEKENLVLKQETQAQRSWIIGLISASIIVLLLGLYYVQRTKRIAAAKRDAAIISERERGLKAIIEATEDERKRIAKDLHDGIVQSLTGLSLRMQKQANSEEVASSKLKNEIDETRAVLDESIAEVRGISHQMMPRVLSEMGLVPALDDMLGKSLGNTEIEYEFEHHNVDEARFKETVEISLYRICQELVNNIIKHSEAKTVSVQLLKTKTHLVLIVEDNGKGFSYEGSGNRNGIGLMNIQSRAKAVDGEVNYEPSPQQGTVASVRVPIV